MTSSSAASNEHLQTSFPDKTANPDPMDATILQCREGMTIVIYPAWYLRLTRETAVTGPWAAR